MIPPYPYPNQELPVVGEQGDILSSASTFYCKNMLLTKEDMVVL
jgi:hypothetical protein